MARTAILGLGHYVPSKVVTNNDLAAMFETSDEWIQQGVISTALKHGYTSMSSSGRTMYEKSTDTPLTTINSTSQCGTPSDSIMSLIDARQSNGCSIEVFRLLRGRKSLRSV